MFSVRIVSTDHYQAAPVAGLDVQYAGQRGSPVNKVPVVRIFGATPAGQKTCMHVHGVFPYLYVPYDGTAPWDRYLRQFATSLDKAINVALGHGQSNQEHVYKIVLVTGRSMYGYHDKEQQFLKIYLYNPSMIRKAADLLLGGAVLNKPFQPHESHIPYTLQLFIDYNLYGMNMINVAAVKFRRQSGQESPGVVGPSPLGSQEGLPQTPGVSFSGLLNRSGSMTPSQQRWDSENIPSELYVGGAVERLSTCELEVDVVAADILNRLEVGDNIGANPGLAALWEDERQRCRDRGLSTDDIAPPESPGRGDVPVADSELELLERLRQIVQDLQPYMDSDVESVSDGSQEDLSMSQASDVDMHLSHDEILAGSQDTVILEPDEVGNRLAAVEPVVNMDSIHRIVSASQSFCDVKPDLERVTSQDRSLVDILAALADDTSPPASQEVEQEVARLEEHDSVLSQVVKPRSQEVEDEEREEILEMSQCIWDTPDNDNSAGSQEYNLAGMDDTWIESPPELQEPGPSTTKPQASGQFPSKAQGSKQSERKSGAHGEEIIEEDSDSDAMSDIIPQYDGATDEHDGMKMTSTKRLGMHGPSFNLSSHHNSPGMMAPNQDSISAENPFNDAPSQPTNYPRSAMPNWGQGHRGPAPGPPQQQPWGPPGSYGSRMRFGAPPMPMGPRGHLSHPSAMNPQQLQSHLQQQQQLLQSQQHQLRHPGGSRFPSGFHGNGSGMMPGNQPVSMPTIYRQHPSAAGVAMGNSPGHSPGRGQRSPGHAGGGQHSPRSFQGHLMPNVSDGFQMAQQHSPQFVATPIHSSPSQAPSLASYPPSAAQQSQSLVHQRIQAAIQSKSANKRFANSPAAMRSGMNMSPGMNTSGMSPDISPSGAPMFPQNPAGLSRYPGYNNDPMSVMSSVETSPRVSYADSINFSPAGQPRLPMTTMASDQDRNLIAQLQQQSAMDGNKFDISTVKQFAKTQGYLLQRPKNLTSGAEGGGNLPLDPASQQSRRTSLFDNDAMNRTGTQALRNTVNTGNNTISQQVLSSPSSQPVPIPNTFGVQHYPLSGESSVNTQCSSSGPQSIVPGTFQHQQMFRRGGEPSSNFPVPSEGSQAQGSPSGMLGLGLSPTGGSQQQHGSPRGSITTNSPQMPNRLSHSRGPTPLDPSFCASPVQKSQPHKPSPVLSTSSSAATAAHYEQISPPVTPMASPGLIKTGPTSVPTQSTPSPSASNASGSNQHLSPLQRLLLDPAPPSSENTADTGQQSHARKAGPGSSGSKTALPDQKSGSAKSPRETATFSPPIARKNFESSKLYTLLAQERQSTSSNKSSPGSQADNSNLSNPGSFQANMNDSQQDLFAEIESQSTEFDNSLASFLENACVKPFTGLDGNSPTNIGVQRPVNQLSGVNRSPAPTTDGNTATLSGLENFVASVTKAPTEFGVDFNKHRPPFNMEDSSSTRGPSMSDANNASLPGISSIPVPQNLDLPGPHSNQGSGMLGNRDNMPMSNMPQSGQFGQRYSPQFSGQSGQSFHMSDSPKTGSQEPNMYGGYNPSNDWPPAPRGRGGGTKASKPRGESTKRGRPRIKKSASVPNGQLVDANNQPVKRKRGRPRKNSELIPPVTHQQLQQQLSGTPIHQSMQMQSQPFDPNSFGGNLGSSMRTSIDSQSNSSMSLFGSQQSFQELLEGEPSDLLAELNAVGNLADEFVDSIPTSQSGQLNGSECFNGLQMMSQSVLSQQNCSPTSIAGINAIASSGRFDQNIGPATVNSQMRSVAPNNPHSMSYSQVSQQGNNQHYEPQQQQHQQHYPLHHQNQFPNPENLQNHGQRYSNPQPQSYPPVPGQLQGSLTQMHSGDHRQDLGFGEEPQNHAEFLSQAMDISEPAVNFDTSLDTSLLMDNQSADSDQYNISPRVEPIVGRVETDIPRQQKILSKVISERKRHPSCSKRTKFSGILGPGQNGTTDISSLIKLIRYRPKSPPAPSPFYTFKFSVPTPVFKRLKFILKSPVESAENPSPPEVVRMHPKDARKYSLLKIGREVVKLTNLSDDTIDELQSRISAGEAVSAIPPAVRQIEVSPEPSVVQDSLIAELLADSPASGEIIETRGVEHVLSESLPSENLNILNQPVENCMPDKGNLDLSPLQLQLQKKAKKPPGVVREKSKDFTFKRNISSVPHLKKFRQGFPYFGKGHVGRGAPASMKPRRSYPQMVEEDENIILKDVSLNDASEGVLTPIKSRTPIAGRSPAHYGGPLGEMEQDKGLLESKLDDLKYDLDLNQSGNSQMFQDELFTEKDIEKEEDAFADADEVVCENEQATTTTSVNIERFESASCDSKYFGIGGETNQKLDTKLRSQSLPPENLLLSHTAVIDIKSELENIDKEATEVKVVEKVTTPIVNTNTIKEMEEDVKPDDLNLFEAEKTYLEMQLAKLQKQEKEGKTEKMEAIADNEDNKLKERKQRTCVMRSRSSSIESCVSCVHCRSNSVPVKVEEGSPDSANGGAMKISKRRHTVESMVVTKRKNRASSTNSSSTTESTKETRSSSADNDRRKHKKMTSKKKHKKARSYRYDSDSDGVPGVDYIVTNRFKGRIELRVVVDKLRMESVDKYVSSSSRRKNGFMNDHIVDRASSTESEVRNKCESEGDSKKPCAKMVTGFSAEFEKFLAQKSQVEDNALNDCENSRESIESTCDDTTCDKNGTNENGVEKVEPASISKDDKSDGIELETYTKLKSNVPRGAKTNDGGHGSKFGLMVIVPKLDMDGAGDRVKVKPESVVKVQNDDTDNNRELVDEAGAMDFVYDSKVVDIDVNADHEMDSEDGEESEKLNNTSDTDTKVMAVQSNEMNHKVESNEDIHLAKITDKNKDHMIAKTTQKMIKSDSNAQLSEEMIKNESIADRAENSDMSMAPITATDAKDYCSSTEDEDSEAIERICAKNNRKHSPGKQSESNKKKRQPNRLHNGRAFCTKRRKRQKGTNRPSKLMCTLSVLHDATMEKLTTAQMCSDVDTSSSNQSPFKSDVESPRRPVKSPDFELYNDKSDDHSTVYEDTMYKLAYLSPIPSDGDNDSPPQPLSPAEMTKIDGTTESAEDKETASPEHKEQKLTMSDILRNMKGDIDNFCARDWEPNSERSSGYNTPSKMAVAKTTTLTLDDIKALCKAELEQEEAEEDVHKQQSMSDNEGLDYCSPILSKEEDNSYSPVLARAKDADTCSPVLMKESDICSPVLVKEFDQCSPVLIKESDTCSPVLIKESDLESPVLTHQMADLSGYRDRCMTEPSSPPPDLGPPVASQHVSDQQSGDSSPPPCLSPSNGHEPWGSHAEHINQANRNQDDSNYAWDMSEAGHMEEATMTNRENSNGGIADPKSPDYRGPPVLYPCRSPKGPKSPKSTLMSCTQMPSLIPPPIPSQPTKPMATSSSTHCARLSDMVSDRDFMVKVNERTSSKELGLKNLLNLEHHGNTKKTIDQGLSPGRSKYPGNNPFYGIQPSLSPSNGRSRINCGSLGQFSIPSGISKSPVHFTSPGKSKSPGNSRSPGSSSSGSINVIHSEEFSDISDENETHCFEDSGPRMKKVRKKIERRVSDSSVFNSNAPHFSGMKPLEMNSEHERQRKLREVEEFEQRMKKQDKGGRTNIFDMLSASAKSLNSSQSYLNSTSPPMDLPCDLSVSSSKMAPQTLNTSSSPQRRSLDEKWLSGGRFDSDFSGRPVPTMQGLLNGPSPPVAHQNSSGLNFPQCSLPGRHSNIEMDYYGNKVSRNGYQRSLSQNEMERMIKSGVSNGFNVNSMHSNAYLHNRSFPGGNGMFIHQNNVASSRHFSRDFQKLNSDSTNSWIKRSEAGSGFSGDLFESGSNVASLDFSVNHSKNVPYHRSLSESGHSEYSIDSSSVIRESFVKNIEQCVNKSQRFSQGCDSFNSSSVPFLEYGGGAGKKRKRSKKSGDQTSSQRDNSGRRDSDSRNTGGQDNFDGFNNSGRGNEGQGRHFDVAKETNFGCQVITPLNPPPSMESIQQSSNEHGLPTVQMTPAFYANHKDVPEKARDGGGVVIKVPSSLVCELEEFQSSVPSITSLKNWRTILSAQQPSQTGSDLLTKMDKEPAIKYAITGDQSIIITPTLLPPSQKSIQKWNQRRQLYKRIKKADKQKLEKLADEKHKDAVEDNKTKPSQDRRTNTDDHEAANTTQSEHEENKLTKKRSKHLRLNLFTGKREYFSQGDSDSQPSSQEIELKKNQDKKTAGDNEESMQIDEPQCSHESLENDSNRQTSTEIDKNPSKSSEKDKVTSQSEEQKMDQDAEKLGDDMIPPSQNSPVHSVLSPDTPSHLHSTPVLRRKSTEQLFDVECTPISGTQRGSAQKEQGTGEEGAGGSFMTPRRIRPLRRLSTNTDTQLRRALLSSQAQQQYGTPSLQRGDSSQIDGPSLKNSFGFKHSQQQIQDAKALHEFQYLTILSVEVHVATRGDLRPDPEHDAIQAIFYSILNDIPPHSGTRHEIGVFIVDPQSAAANEKAGNSKTSTPTGSANQESDDKVSMKPSANQKAGDNSLAGTSASKKTENKRSTDPTPGTSSDVGHQESEVKGCSRSEKTLLEKSGVSGVKVTYVKDEQELFKTFIDFVMKWDPDILVGFEIQMLSWGFVLQRASTLSINLAQAISRVPSARSSSHRSTEKDEYGADRMTEINIAGRIVLNLWFIVRHEVTLNVYSFENVVFHVLHKRVPQYPFRSLTAWFQHRTHLHRWKVVEHYVCRVQACQDIMEQLDLVGTTSEFARVFGIEFYHVLSRGSQYRVESMMLRVAKPMSYIPVSPSVHQRARMKAPECIALTLEPESRFYTDPVIVLDFQSLYPSIMIAYNYCFSTCLGRVNWMDKAHEGSIEFGCTSLNLEPSVIQKLSSKVTFSPNGVAFCKESVKRGILPTMLQEILKTRLMVKKAMGGYKGDKTLSRMLNARQLGLKLIANVTYGYTGANFSGRMPCIEVADSIVRKARETLERSIQLVENTPRWGAKVVYGDTDSMFILLKGRSKDEAFAIGKEMAKAVTEMFPKPIKLKFEKVYLPCVLQTKKRYVGFMYETPDQKEPVYDAKGIETVRRDTCAAVSKVLERSIKVLFTTRDVSAVKAYVQQQCSKVMEGAVSLQDFIFAKEYRGMSGYRPGACVPALEIAKKHLRVDRRSEPRVGERVPYVIVYGSPGLPLIQLVREPRELLTDPGLRLNATYYITKQILPPLNRFLSLLGADVFSWYQEMPHSLGRVAAHVGRADQGSKKGTISQYFATSACPVCEVKQTKQPVCTDCIKHPQLVAVCLSDRITRAERVHQHLNMVCGTCTGVRDKATTDMCISIDCPIMYRKSRSRVDIGRAQTYREVLHKLLK